MPSPVDLTGQVFGQLDVLASTGAFHHDSKRSRIWLCHCNQCGRDEEIPQNLLPHNTSQSSKRGVRYACSVCSRGACVVCGGEITHNTKGNTCSDECHQQKNKNTQNLFYAKRIALDPDVNRKAKAKRKERAVDDPALAEHLKSLEKEAYHRKVANPEYVERRKKYHAMRYAQNRDEIQAQRKRFWDSLSVEEQEQRRDAKREAYQAFQRRFYEWLRANPAEYQQHIAWQRAYRTERNRQIELAKLQQTFVELNKHE